MNKFSTPIKKILIGRDYALLDKFIYYLSNKNSSGWLIGNRLRSIAYGKKKGKSNLPIIFIGCFPRSGSTLLRAILQEHPDICASQTEINIFQDIKNINTSQMNVVDAFNISTDEVNHIKHKNNLIEVADYILNNYIQRNNAKYVLLKQPKHIFFIKHIFKHYPNSKFIHIIRDGRDATMSQRYYMLPKNKTEWSYEWCCRQWNVCINQGKKFRNNDNYIEVKYEDLVKKPLDTINRIFKFLNLKEQDKRILENYYKNFDGSKTFEHKDVAKPITDKGVNKWLNKMSNKDKQIFKKICHYG